MRSSYLVTTPARPSARSSGRGPVRLGSGLLLSLLVLAGAADAEIWRNRAFRFVGDRPVRIIVLRPDIEVGSIDSGGMEEADADWTAAARAKLTGQIEAQQRALGNMIVFLPDLRGEQAKLVADYSALLRTVAAAAAAADIEPASALRGRARGNWTLGPGAARIGAIGGGDYALLVRTRDSFSTSGRKVFHMLTRQIAGMLLNGTGIHRAYAALVDLTTGDLVWLNVDPRAGGDPRTDEGAAKRVAQLFSRFPAHQPPRSASAPPP